MRTFSLVLFYAALSACASAPAPAAQATHAETPAAVSGKIRWIGGPTALLEYAGLRAITDPMLGPRGPNAFVLPKHPSSGVLNAPIARYTAPASFTFAGLDAILISHTHADHVDARAKELLPKHLPLVVAAAGGDAMRAAGFSDVRGLDWGESTTISARGVTLRVLAVPAHHSHEADVDREVGKGNGYILEWSGAGGNYRVYWTGDAVLGDETRDFSAHFGQVDLLLPHMGGVGGDGERGLRTMNADELLELVQRVQPRLVVPIHHTTFGHYREPIEALEQRVQEAGDGSRFVFLREGEASGLPKS